jgi:hypothetical protein
MSTISKIVQRSGSKIGVSGMTADEISDGVDALNEMLKEWASGPQKVNAISRETLSISSSSASYTVGSGGDLDTTWPTKITSAFIRENDSDYPLGTFSSEDYAYTGRKADSQRPGALYYERTYPLGTFFFWPTPDKSYTVHLWMNKPFTTYTVNSSSLGLPPEYEAAIIWNLAIEIAPEYEKEPSAIVIGRAERTLRTLKNMNLHPIPRIDTNPLKGPWSSASLFSGYDSAMVGSATLPFVLR